MSVLPRLVGRLPRRWIQVASAAQFRYPAAKRGFEWVAVRIRNRDGVVQQGAGKGLRFNTGSSNPGYLLGTSEPLVQRAMAELIRPGMVVWDVGANVGFLSMIAARLVGPSGRILCFEPLRENALQIEHNARLNRFRQVEVRQEALGDRDGPERFEVSQERGWGRLRLPGLARVESKIAEAEVAVRRLDSLVEAGDVPVPDFIKMDVEGGELGVLDGGRATLQRYQPGLLIELHGTNRGVADRLAALGYAARVLEADVPVTEAPWYAHVVATPLQA